MAEIAHSLDQAFRRLNDFAAVQRGRGTDELPDAVLRLLESVGIADAARVVVRERVEAIEGTREPHAGQILYGVIVGLMAAELEHESAR